MMKRNFFILITTGLMLLSISCSNSNDDNQTCDPTTGICTTNGIATQCTQVGQTCTNGALSGVCNANLQCQLNNGGIGNTCIGQANGTICNVNGLQGQCSNQVCITNNNGGGGYYPPGHGGGHSYRHCRYLQRWNWYTYSYETYIDCRRGGYSHY